MNSKKSKSKNRPKAAKPPQNAPDAVKVEDPSNVEVDKCENVVKDEISVSEQVVEVVPVVEEQLASDTPKKPKRSKAKKKQDVIIETAVTEDNLNKSAPIEEQKVIESEVQEAAEVVPVARKKKNKSKKKADQTKPEEDQSKLEEEQKPLECETKKVEETQNINSETKNDSEEIDKNQFLEVPQKDSTASKKKKKKKHRNDSEKSDVNDPCTLAFQKLLKSSEDAKDKSENEEVLSENITSKDDDLIPLSTAESNKSDDLKEIVKDEGSKSKKKNKKAKKHPSEAEVNINKESQPEHVEEIKNNKNEDIAITENIELETTDVELSSKPKAKIIKPVQKKRKTKSESQEVNIAAPAEIDSENKSECSKDILDKQEILTDSNTKIEVKQKDESVIKIEPSIDTLTSLKSDLKEADGKSSPIIISEKIDSSNAPVKELPSLDVLTKSQSESKISENKESQQEKDKILTETNKESDDLGFVHVKSGKHKKKRLQSNETVPVSEIIETVTAQTSKNVDINKPEKESDQKKDQKETFFDISQLDFEETSFKSEEFESLSIATPDLIQYPRSTSQQHLDDNNNNTLIEEITTSDEVKLGIPIYTATPIIQGSGESPDAKTLNEPVKIKVTEVESTSGNSNNEKNDIKSRIFEVNKDMEELRRSIERSLAELTGAEKCDSEVDKEFEELFQSQIKDSQAPSTLQAKVENIPQANPTFKSKQDESIIEVKKEPTDTMKEKNDDLNVMKKRDEHKPANIDIAKQTLTTDDTTQKPEEIVDTKDPVPICPARNKGKSKSKKKGKKEPVSTTSTSSSTTQQTDTTNKDSSKPSKSDANKSEQKQQPSKEKGKQQSTAPPEDSEANSKQLKLDLSFEPIENFEDALTSSVDDVNTTFEIIVNESLRQNNPQINIIAPVEDTEDRDKEKQKQNPVSQPKNLLGKPNIPASSNKTDFKKEKNKPPNSIQAKVKIKDSVDIDKEVNKQSKESEMRKLIKESNGHDTYSFLSNTNEDFVYKYSFRKVFLQSSCHVCKRDLIHRFPCKFCSLVFYCSQKHLDEDWAKHQSLCFAVSTIAHLKEQKHIYADAQNITGHDYRVLRMHMILSCEKILKRNLVPWEQEALLYPRLCADTSCRQWKQRMLKDCEGCGQISYCIDHPEHLPISHQRWCKSYALYQKLVNYQQTKGRLEPRLPTKVLDSYKIPEIMNEVLGTIYEEKIDMDDVQYAALTQLASAPLTAAYGHQLYTSKMNSTCANGVSKKSTFTIHAIGTDQQFEADCLNKWEIFFLHLRPDVQDLRVVFIGPELNPLKLPLDLLGQIKLCANCRANKRRVLFHFHDKETYSDYYASDDFITPDIVCAFNPSIHRSSMYNVKDTWPATISTVLKQKVPFLITSYSIEELERDVSRVRETAACRVTSEPRPNPFSSVRPDRNFITDHEMPLLFKNYSYTLLCGVV